jgi:hypothetical protein
MKIVMNYLQYITHARLCCHDYLYLHHQNFSILIGVYFFCSLKINHDSHEFILEFDTVANNKIHWY